MSKAPDAIRKYLTPLQSSDGVPLPRRGHHGSPLMSSPRRITTTHHPAFPAPSQTAAQARAGFQLPATDHYCHLLLHFNIPPLLSPWKSTSRFSSPAVSRSSPPPRWRSKMIDEGWPQPSLIYCYQHTYEAQDRARCRDGRTAPIELESPQRTEQVPYQVPKQRWLDQDCSAQGHAIVLLHFSGSRTISIARSAPRHSQTLYASTAARASNPAHTSPRCSPKAINKR